MPYAPVHLSSAPRRIARAPAWLVTLLAAVLLLPMVPLPAAASGVTLAGTVFQDLDADAVRDPGEAVFVDHLVYLEDLTGRVLATQRSGADGRFSFTVPAGTYTVRSAPTAWRSLWSEWVPTTTGSLEPVHVAVTAPATVDLGWRPIVRSDDVAAPISAYRGASGLTVESYNDVVSAREVHDHLVGSFLVTGEAPSVLVRFGYRDLNANSTTVARRDGVVTDVRSVSYSSYERWLAAGDRTMAHEYGHAWMNHHLYLGWDDGWEALLVARGIDPQDTRLGSSHSWQPAEIAAEDYRQLFASEHARAGAQLNRDLPLPGEVEGYATWLRDVFADTAAGEPAPDPEAGPEPEPAPIEESTPDPVEEPVSDPAPAPEPDEEPETSLPPGRDTARVPPGRAKR